MRERILAGTLGEKNMEQEVMLKAGCSGAGIWVV